jgi:hypothetical protein
MSGSAEQNGFGRAFLHRMQGKMDLRSFSSLKQSRNPIGLKKILHTYTQPIQHPFVY